MGFGQAKGEKRALSAERHMKSQFGAPRSVGTAVTVIGGHNVKLLELHNPPMTIYASALI